MTAWSVVPASELCTLIVDCVNKTAPVVDHETPFKMIRTTNVRDGWVDTSAVRHVDATTYAKWTRRGEPRRGDVILTREAPLGDVGMLRSDAKIFLGQRLVMYRANPSVCDPRFLMYAMLGQDVQAELRRLGSGSTVEHLRVPDCASLAIPTPALSVQRAIGALLGGIDDLIENNRRRVEVLEEMARTIYREWFVHFRYPGREDATSVGSPLDAIPDGWEHGCVDDLVELIKVTVDPNKTDPATPAVGLEHIPRHRLTLDTWGSAKGLGSRKGIFAKGDVLFGKIRPYFHKVSVAPIPGVCSTDAIVLRPTPLHWGQAVLTVSSDEFVAFATQTSNGTKMPRANWDVIRRFPLFVPPEALASRFTQLSQSLLDQARVLMLQARKAEAMRDLLLPRLVSGQVDVSSLDLDALVEGAVA